MKEYIVAEHPDFLYEEPKPQELIRCKDCKHFVLVRGWRYIGEPDYMHCDMFMDSHSPWAGSDYEPSAEDYCSRAERKEE